MKNPTLTKNMKHVKWKAIPPLTIDIEQKYLPRAGVLGK